MNHKPMLAVDCGGIEEVAYPVIASPKLDGVRAIITADGVLSRSLKPIPNRHVQTLLDSLPVGFDGELIVGDPTAPDAYRRTVSVVMSDDAPIEGLRYHVFDYQGEGGYWDRLGRYHALLKTLANTSAIATVPTYLVTEPSDLSALEERLVEQGYEGVMLRSQHAPYKHGRSTRREGYLLKLKRFVDSEAEVIGVTELMHNANEATVNALGRTERSSHKAGKVGRGVLGALQVRDVVTGVEFEIGTGFTAAERAELWAKYQRTSTFGLHGWPLAKYKYFAGGSKDKPRFPVFLGWRDARDV
jgi:DNA ligase-1